MSDDRIIMCNDHCKEDSDTKCFDKCKEDSDTKCFDKCKEDSDHRCFDKCVNAFRTDYISNPSAKKCKKLCEEMFDYDNTEYHPDEFNCCVNECNKVLDVDGEGFDSKGAVLLDDTNTWYYSYFYPKDLHGKVPIDPQKPNGAKFDNTEVKYVVDALKDGKSHNGKKYPKTINYVGYPINRCNARDIYVPLHPAELNEDVHRLSNDYCIDASVPKRGWRFATCIRKKGNKSCAEALKTCPGGHPGSDPKSVIKYDRTNMLNMIYGGFTP